MQRGGRSGEGLVDAGLNELRLPTVSTREHIKSLISGINLDLY